MIMNKIHTVQSVGAQGDLLFVRVEFISSTAQRQDAVDNRYVLARGDSAAGEHFTSAEGVTYFLGANDRTAYLQVTEYTDIVHSRSTDTHATLRLTSGYWLVRRQREHTPDGFRRVED